MALRMVLVGLVVCLGFDGPSAEDFGAWRDSGRDWVAARWVEVSSFRGEVERAWAGSDRPESPGDAPIKADPGAISGRVDLAFDAVVEAMTSEFAADLAAMRSISEANGAVAALPPVEFGNSAGVVASEDEIEAVDEPPAPTSRLDRISEAFRLTRKAVDAWASVIRTSEDGAEESSRDDAF